MNSFKKTISFLLLSVIILVTFHGIPHYHHTHSGEHEVIHHFPHNIKRTLQITENTTNEHSLLSVVLDQHSHTHHPHEHQLTYYSRSEYFNLTQDVFYPVCIISHDFNIDLNPKQDFVLVDSHFIPDPYYDNLTSRGPPSLIADKLSTN